MFYLACFIILASRLNAEQIKTVRVNIVVEDHILSQDITTDPDRNTDLSVVGQANDLKEFKSSVNLHDYNAGYVALKTIADGECLLKPISRDRNDHVPDSGELLLKNGQKYLPWHKTMYWNKDSKVMTYEGVKQLAGELLAEYCRDYKTYKLIPKTVRTMSMRSYEDRNLRRSKRKSLLCWSCVNEIDGYEEDFIDTANKDF